MKPLYSSLLVLMALLLDSMCGPVAAQGLRPQVELPDEPVRGAIFRNCSACHGIDPYAYFALDRQGWRELIDQLHQDDNSVHLNGSDETALLDFLSEQFGADSIAFPRVYEPPTVTETFTDVEARVFMDGVCTECHELRVFKQRNTPAKWRDLMLDMRGNGAVLSDVEMEKLVEWLGRMRGVEATR
jgi:cytochrome c553